ncbi:hypothetical protein [Mycobacterium sp.]|uniref:hypothetical protein n=1 Tax=Mycobacterium sp. TaxID=1785 RepID=UPI002CE76584|nr:hypothetical protein [Mycobacterium sp.]HTY33142.1 hypothetical protein [Mycobacterium sp.]
MANRPNPSPYSPARDDNVGSGYAFDAEADVATVHQGFGAGALGTSQRPTDLGEPPQPPLSSPTYPRGERLDDNRVFGDAASAASQLPTKGDDRAPQTTPTRFTYPSVRGPGGRLGTTS